MPDDSPTVVATNPLDSHVGYHLRRASAFVMATLADGLADLGLRIVETSMLIVIDSNPGIYQSELGRVLAISRANVAPMVGNLEQRKLIGRVALEGRLVGLITTPEGHDLAKRAERLMREIDEQIFSSLSPHVRTTLATSLETLWRSKGRKRE